MKKVILILAMALLFPLQAHADNNPTFLSYGPGISIEKTAVKAKLIQNELKQTVTANGVDASQIVEIAKYESDSAHTEAIPQFMVPVTKFVMYASSLKALELYIQRTSNTPVFFYLTYEDVKTILKMSSIPNDLTIAKGNDGNYHFTDPVWELANQRYFQ
jgi:hypothetical protein